MKYDSIECGHFKVYPYFSRCARNQLKLWRFQQIFRECLSIVAHYLMICAENLQHSIASGIQMTKVSKYRDGDSIISNHSLEATFPSLICRQYSSRAAFRYFPKLPFFLFPRLRSLALIRVAFFLAPPVAYRRPA